MTTINPDRMLLNGLAQSLYEGDEAEIYEKIQQIPSSIQNRIYAPFWKKNQTWCTASTECKMRAVEIVLTDLVLEDLLNEIIHLLIEGDTSESYKKIQALPYHTRMQLYSRLEKLHNGQVDPVTGLETESFDDEKTSLEKKVDTIITILTSLRVTDIESLRILKQEPCLAGKPVQMNSFHDCGFDPRFSEDGTIYLRQSQLCSSHFLITIQKKAMAILFRVKAYFSFNQEDKALSKLILSCAKLEKQYSSCTYDAFVTFDDSSVNPNVSSRAMKVLPAIEHAFFEELSTLFKELNPGYFYEPRLFPSEILFSIHKMNKPQGEYTSTMKCARPFYENKQGRRWYNEDLDRGMRFGLFRLHEPQPSQTLEDNSKDAYLPHYLFIHETQQENQALKSACRSLRNTLSRIATEISSGTTSLDLCKTEMRNEIKAFKICWDNYVESNDILKKSQDVFSQVDYYAEEYKVGRWEARYIPPSLYSAYQRYCGHRYGHTEYWYNKARDAGYASFKQSYAHTQTT